jgi:hypothetical protein
MVRREDVTMPLHADEFGGRRSGIAHAPEMAAGGRSRRES